MKLANLLVENLTVFCLTKSAFKFFIFSILVTDCLAKVSAECFSSTGGDISPNLTSSLSTLAVMEGEPTFYFVDYLRLGEFILLPLFFSFSFSFSFSASFNFFSS